MKRLESLDALRGFDMFFIMGFSTLVIQICGLFPDSAVATWFSTQMNHVPWDGFQHHDSIFPLFLFIAGCSFPFSFAKQIEKGASKSRISLRAVKRALVLVLFGLICNGLFKWQFASIRIFSVLGRIGIAWGCAALLYIWCSRNWRIAISVFILLGYAILSAVFIAPDAPEGASPFSVEGNISCWIDRVLFPKHIYRPLYDPEGLFSTLPAVVTASLGMMTGELLRSERMDQSRKCLWMLGGGVGFVVLGLLWGLWIPINKALWSSSFVCLLAGYSLLNLLIFYWLIDVKGYRKWAFFFKVIGMNSITIYMAQKIIPFKNIANFFFSGTAALLPDSGAKILIQVAYLGFSWLFLYLLYKQKIFLKV